MRLTPHQHPICPHFIITQPSLPPLTLSLYPAELAFRLVAGPPAYWDLTHLEADAVLTSGIAPPERPQIIVRGTPHLPSPLRPLPSSLNPPLPPPPPDRFLQQPRRLGQGHVPAASGGL